MKATLENKVVATADAEELIKIEGNQYFPPDSINWSILKISSTKYVCPWKGQAEYYSFIDGPQDVAWAYRAPNADAIKRVGEDFTKFVAFDQVVVISE